MGCSKSRFPVLHYLLEFAQTYVCGVHNDLQPSHPLFPTPPLALKFSLHHGLSDELAFCIRWSKGWSFSFSISPSSEGLISFRIDWFDLLAVQGTLESLLHHHSLKASVLWCSAFFMVHEVAIVLPLSYQGDDAQLLEQVMQENLTSRKNYYR